MNTKAHGVVALAVLLLGCGDDSEPAAPVVAPPEACEPPSRVVGEACIEPGVQDNGCPAGTLGLDDGTCQPAGVPPEKCAEGFEHDGDAACEPILPPDRCPPGQMAVPGETACHPVMDCGSGRWGDIPVDGSTVYVDAAYTGGTSDGSEQQPYTSVSAAVAAAADGAIIAIAAGTYNEDVVVQKRVRLWGVCPDQVAIAGVGIQPGALFLRPGASGSEVRGVAVTGGGYGIVVSGVENVVVERVWVHDTVELGISFEGTLGATAVTLARALVESNPDTGVYVSGAGAVLDSVVVRATLPVATNQQFGHGIVVRDGSNPTVSGSLVEDNHEAGVFLAGSQATLDGVVVRKTLPNAGNQLAGRGIVIQPGSGVPSSATVNRSLIEDNHEVGVFVASSEASFDGVVVRDTQPRDRDLGGGTGVSIEPDFQLRTPASVVLTSSLVERNHESGVFVSGSEATLSSVLVRDTLPRESDQWAGRGVVLQLNPTTGEPANASVVGSLVERCHEVGVFAAGSQGVFDGVVVRNTLPRPADQLFGAGFHFAAASDDLVPADVTFTSSLVEDNHDIGVLVSTSDATIHGVLVRRTAARQFDGQLGDGLVIAAGRRGTPVAASAVVTHCRSDNNARAGLSNFGAQVALQTTALVCNGFDLAGEIFRDVPYSFDDRGDNGCGCPEPAEPCTAETSGLAPPEPLTDP